MHKTWPTTLLFASLLITGCGQTPGDAPAAKTQRGLESLHDTISLAMQANTLKGAARSQLQTQAEQRLKTAEKDIRRVQAFAERQARWAATMQQAAEEARTRLLHASLEQARLEALLAKQQRITAEAEQQARLRLQIAQDAIRQNSRAQALLAKLQAKRQLALATLERLDPAPATSVPVTRMAQHHPMQPRKVAHTAPTPNKAKPIKIAAATPHEPTTPKPVQLGDARHGQQLARKCQLCHTFEPGKPGRFGPNLYGILEQPAGKQPGFHYSHALARAEFSWRQPELQAFLCHSGKAIKQLTGNHRATTKMPPQHICGQDANDIIAYLRELKMRAAKAQDERSEG